MRIINQLAFFLIMSMLLVSCDWFDNDDDDDGATGGSGTVAESTTAPSTSQSTSTTTATNTTITLNAFGGFSCTGNWTNRDGALGLKAYSGSGSCVTTFNGASGTYKVAVVAQTEFDGHPQYTVSVNGQAICGGVYPLSSALGCDCPLESWYKVCPDRNMILNCATVNINTGDQISFYGAEDFPCGSDHGAYAKWHAITLTPVN